MQQIMPHRLLSRRRVLLIQAPLYLIENQKQNPRSYSLYKLLFALDIDITKDLKEDISQQDVKDKIIRKLNLMTDSQKESLLKLIDNFEIIAK